MADFIPLTPQLKEDIQANILKGHGRKYAVFLFFRFLEEVNAKYVRGQLNCLSKNQLTSYAAQCDQTRLHKSIDDVEVGVMSDEKHMKSSIISLYLSYAGYKQLGIDNRFIPLDNAFRTGMIKDRQAVLWLGDYRNHIVQDIFKREDGVHGILMVANESKAAMENCLKSLLKHNLKDVIQSRTVLRQDASFLRDENNGFREHFGYVDGISTPTDENILSKIGLVAEPTGQKIVGSYVAFRKLEQDLVRFEQIVTDLKNQLNINNDEPVNSEFVKALLMGRFSNGTPVTRFSESQPPYKWADQDFDYDQDDGRRCPFHAHIRAVNPRKKRDKEGNLVPVPIIRRSMTYNEGENQKGLWFISYQRSLEKDLLPLFRNMGVENPEVKDSITYRARNRNPTRPYFKKYDRPDAGIVQYRAIGLRQMTTFLGGEYFFAPPLSFFRNLDRYITDRIDPDK